MQLINKISLNFLESFIKRSPSKRSKAQPSFIRKLKFELFLINIIKANLHLVNDCSHLAILNQNLVAEHLCAFFIF